MPRDQIEPGANWLQATIASILDVQPLCRRRIVNMSYPNGGGGYAAGGYGGYPPSGYPAYPDYAAPSYNAPPPHYPPQDPYRQAPRYDQQQPTWNASPPPPQQYRGEDPRNLPPPDMNNNPHAFRRFFDSHLVSLTFNSKPVITNLTMLAHQHMMRMSSVIATAMEDHLRNVSHFVHLEMEELGTYGDRYRFARCPVTFPMEARIKALVEVVLVTEALDLLCFVFGPITAVYLTTRLHYVRRSATPARELSAPSLLSVLREDRSDAL